MTTTSTFTEDTEPKVMIDCQWARCDSTLEVSRVKFSGAFDWVGPLRRLWRPAPDLGRR